MIEPAAPAEAQSSEILPGGYATYGHPVGILTLDMRFARIPGDVGNATSFPFPVLYKVISGASSQRIVDLADPALIEPFCQGARELEAAGCRAITTSCGFLALFQRELAAAVEGVPVFASALIQVPLVHRMLPPGRKVGILTARKRALTERHFNGVGWSSSEVPVVVHGMDDEEIWGRGIGDHATGLDRAGTEAAVLRQARRMLADEPSIGAYVFECTNLPPYAAAVQRATGLPVFDIITLITMIGSVVTRRVYTGFM